MSYSIEGKSNSNVQLPPGFRFHPSDEELIVHYLKNKATSNHLPASLISEVEQLYKFDPWELPKKAMFGKEEWFFFTTRDRKYPNGVRPNRMAASGYWKATGTDHPIFSSHGVMIIGIKKGLVFYKGHPPRGVQTDWIMHEYRLPETMICTSTRKRTIRLENWVLCRLEQKSSTPRNNGEDQHSLRDDYFSRVDKLSSKNTNPNLGKVRGSLFKDCPMLPFLFDSQLNFPCMGALSSLSLESSETSTPVHYNYSNGENFQVSLTKRQRKVVEIINQLENSIQPNEMLKNRENQEDERLSPSNITTNMKFYRTDQRESNNLNDDQWSSIMQYQDKSAWRSHISM